ncbi:MAG: tetratricopeptide repeat protein [Alphaproteobacteria bacterium]|nr:tetratricopeptide repeat protein [Alphaproteobacteria bacterium]
MLTRRGRAQLAKGDLQRAVEDAYAAIQLNVAFAPAFELRADILRQNQQCELAIADYDRAIELAPTNPTALISRALCHNAQHKSDAAVADLDQAIKRDPENKGGFAALAWSVKAQLAREKNDLQQALASYGEAIRLDPGKAAFYLERADVWLANQDAEHAVGDLDEAVKRDPANAGGYAVSALIAKSRVRASKGDLGAAIAALDAAAALTPQRAAVYLERAALLLRKDDEEGALADFDRAIKAEPKSADTYNARGNYLQSRYKYAEAIADYDKAIEVEPNDLTAFNSRALVRWYLGEFAKAADDFKRVTASQPDAYAAALAYLALFRSGDAKGAKAELAKDLAMLKGGDWPYPVVEMFLGRKTPQAVETVAAKATEKCDAHFYIAQWHLVRGEKAPAAKGLQAAIAGCPKDVAEYRAAEAELKRIAP